MIPYINLLKNKVPLKNVKYSTRDRSANLVFLTENYADSVKTFLDTQIKSYYGEITIPGIITNFVGKRLSSQAYYLDIKKELPNYIMNRAASSKQPDDKTNIFDMSAISDEIINLSLSRSKKLVFTEMMKLIDSAIQDNKSDDNLMFIYGAMHGNTYFLELLKYSSILSGGQLKSDLSGIIYFFNDKHYPVASTKTIKDEKYLVFNKNILELLIKNIKNTKHGKEEISNIDKDAIDEAKTKVTELASKLDAEDKEEYKKNLEAIKEVVHKVPELEGTFEEKLEQLYKKEKEVQQDTPIDKISKSLKDINEKYNGNIKVDIKSTDPINPQTIVGMDNLGNYNKQEQELNANMDDNIEDLIESTLLADKDLNITVLSIKSKIVDNNSDRYKEYTIRIQHKDIGNTTNKPYNITLRTPIAVQGKYTRIGGNNYIMINQLFSSPISKVSPNLIRFYTHFGTTSLELKGSSLSANKDFKEIEDRLVQDLKSIKAIDSTKLTKFDPKKKDDIIDKYNIPDLESFGYSKMEITI